MKNFFAIAIFLTLSALIANGQHPPCDPEAETALYNKFLENRDGTPEQKKLANDAGKEYVAKFGECPSVGEKKVTAFIKDWFVIYQAWLVKYEARIIETNCTNAVDK